MSIDWIVVDVEIQKTIEETPGGWEATDLLGVAVACVWQYRDQRMRVYGPDDVPVLRDRLMKADRISGFNIWKFDFPVIFGLPGRQRVESLRYKTDDMLRRIWQALKLNADQFSSLHKGWGLDAVAGATLNARKIGYGGDAPKWFQQGKIQQVANYCCDDVALQRDLTDFVERYGYVLNPGQDDSPLKIPPWTPESMKLKETK
jgi:DEAD/DEAH box helicase domain-containing protein